ncbi:hypothetical protein [Algoriphagus boritolerans]|uniref:hypothetical protein n=1 Tax=Algoriphagus boritolerans TaxID=308111 RepID=UPI0011B09A58|nr:hypothetical protein [Algoriphagus boritolerans]
MKNFLLTCFLALLCLKIADFLVSIPLKFLLVRLRNATVGKPISPDGGGHISPKRISSRFPGTYLIHFNY